jgi:hypothetical protein
MMMALVSYGLNDITVRAANDPQRSSSAPALALLGAPTADRPGPRDVNPTLSD